jgi:D-beta-D-heptose 7-phosphate kinase/D-beta-D-heptose 1-phosphate adenosyltransferase
LDGAPLLFLLPAPAAARISSARIAAFAGLYPPEGFENLAPGQAQGHQSMTNLLDVLAGFENARVLVVGDVMLDRFRYGRVSRISPEAPVPVLAVERETDTLGGAGNVARNIASLGGRATLIAGRGNDAAGLRIAALLEKEASITDALLVRAEAATTEKLRYIAGRQQVLRADREASWPEGGEADALAAAEAAIADHDVMVISDYAKGFLTPGLLRGLIALARAAKKPLIADPKGLDFSRYDGASVITPNRQEAEQATGLEGQGDGAAAGMAQAILQRLPHLGAVALTRGPDGLSLAERGREPIHVASRPRAVFDVSGAGDTLVAALALALAAGAGLENAARLANLAAGIAVTMVGTAAVAAADLREAIQSRQLAMAERKIVSAEQAQAMVEGWRASGFKIGFTNGCFDLLHPGHVALLSEARAHCDRLVVGLNADASVKRLKGDTRPVQDETARAIVLASLAMVDLVTVFREDTPDALIRRLRPDVLVKGADYKRADIVGADFVESYGGEVVRAALVPDHSTTALVGRAQR